ncbi:MAG: AAA family ATPase [Leadbetterella sp.]
MELEQEQNEDIFKSRVDLNLLNKASRDIEKEIGKVIVGQQRTLKLILTSLFCGGHVLLEGVPGVAKTLTAKLLSQSLDINFRRIQFTPDLMPSDVLGTSVFNPKNLEFEFKKGPVFSNLVLIDEINRSPAKTQAAMFELMEERQVTIDGNTYPMDEPFLVIATQNPIEHEGTYRLPEAQLDRFFMKIKVGYPTAEEEFSMLQRFNYNSPNQIVKEVNKILPRKNLLEIKSTIQSIIVEENIVRYVSNIIQATRNHKQVELGASPRAAIVLVQASKAWAALQGRDFVLPEDIKSILPSILGHRIILTAEAEMEGIATDDILTEISNAIEVPR